MLRVRLGWSVQASMYSLTVVGFGIASGEQAATAARYADGVVVGSALVRRLDDGVDAARDLMNELRGALKNGAAVAQAVRDEAD